MSVNQDEPHLPVYAQGGFYYAKTKDGQKVRAIAGILYTDSAPADWQIGLLICT